MIRIFLFFILFTIPLHSASIKLNIDLGGPTFGRVFVSVYNSEASFKKMEGSVVKQVFDISPTRSYTLETVPTGTIAVMAFYDVNNNGKLDKNFIGIPKEPVALSNDYRPKGPPSFKQASIRISEGKETQVNLIFSSSKKTAIVSFGGVGLMSSSYYKGVEGVRVLAVPSLTYIGDRVQVFGPRVQAGILKTDRFSLTGSSAFIMSAYKKEDSYLFTELAEKESRVFAGLTAEWRVFNARLSVGREGNGRDVVDKLGISQQYSVKEFNVSPSLKVKKLNSAYAQDGFSMNKDYIPQDAYIYSPGLTVSSFLTDKWTFFLSVNIDILCDSLRESPLVEKRYAYSGIVSISRMI